MHKRRIPLFFVLVLFLSFAFQKAKTQDRVSVSKLEGQTPVLPVQSVGSSPRDTIASLPVDTFPADSLSNDTLPADTVSSNAIDAPVDYSATDSIIMTMDGSNLIRLYGDAKVTYKDLELTGAYIEINADKDMVYATFALDSLGEETGYPVFKDAGNQYEMRQMWYNFKTKKGYIVDVITEQGEGYVTAGQTKKLDNDDLFMRDGMYTTCDDHDHPHFYFHLTKAKVRPKKNIVTGPAYLVLEGVPLPIFVPFAFFPFTSDYSSGIIPPSYGDEMSRGFSLRDGGYYFAINDYVDMALTGEIYTKGSWGLNARSSYSKRYKFSGSVNASYLVTKTEDVSTAKDFRVTWSHSQNAKANPFSTFSANVNFTTSSYNKNSVTSMYTTDSYQNTKSSSVNYTRRFPNTPWSISTNATINQQSRDTSLSVTLPNLTITMSEVYPFRRREQIGKSPWYEAIRLNYTGLLMNSISNVKEYEFMKKNLIKDWRNGMKHDIPVSASFNLFNYINITPNVSYTSRWYTTKINQSYDPNAKRVLPTDTIYGFYRIYDYRGGVSLNTKVYGFFAPWGIFGDWAKRTKIRHAMTPSVSFSAAPDFGDPRYGYYKDLYYYDPVREQMDTLNYSPYSTGLWGVPGKGRSGTMSFRLENNVEAKYEAQDTTKKYSIIDNLGLGISYNFLADSMKWSNLSASLRLKLSKSFTLNLQGTFDTYTYSEKGTRINVPRWEAGKGLGRLMNTGTSFSYSLNNDVIKKWFGKSEDKNPKGTDKTSSGTEGESGEETGQSELAKPNSLRAKKSNDGAFDSDGYMMMSIPWNLSFNYSMSLGYDNTKFNTQTREFDYRITKTLGFSGNITPTKNWSFNFNTSYDFDNNKFAYMQCSLSRNLHCWQMTASIIPIGPYQSYSFTISVNASMLKDLKYTQSSNYRDSQTWD